MKLERYAVVDHPGDFAITWTTESYAEARAVAARRGGCVIVLTFELTLTELAEDYRPRGEAVIG